jgi:hypothetical protein
VLAISKAKGFERTTPLASSADRRIKLLGTSIYERLPLPIRHCPNRDIGENHQSRRDHQPDFLAKSVAPPHAPRAPDQCKSGQHADRENDIHHHYRIKAVDDGRKSDGFGMVFFARRA